MFPLGSHLEDIARLADADVNVCLYREYGRMLCEALDRPYLQAPIGLNSTTAFLNKLGELLDLDAQPFIEQEKHTTLKPLWDLWRSVTQDFFSSSSFGIVATDTYARGVRAFLEDDLGMPCAFSFSRNAGVKPDNQTIAKAVREAAPMLLFGSYNERMYAAEAGGRSRFMPASFPGAIVRRHIGTPFMGYSGASYLTQEVCNALFDALFDILPLGGALDDTSPTLSRLSGLQIDQADAGMAPLEWSSEATRTLEEELARTPVLVRISAAKQLRDTAERLTRDRREEEVSAAIVQQVIERMERTA